MMSRPSTLLATLLVAASIQVCAANTIEPAVVGGQAITSEELTARFADQASRRTRSLDVQLKRMRVQHERDMDGARRALLESMIDERLLQLEAASTGQSAESLLATVVVPPVSDQDVRAAATRGQPANDAPLDPDLAGRVRQQLENQARDGAIRGYLRQLASHYGVRMQLEPRREAVTVDDSPKRGAQNPRVTIVEFADFQCPFCLRVESTLKRVLDEHPEDVQLVFKQLPIPELHQDAERLARGAVCAAAQGKFWEFHDAVFANPGRVDNGRMLRIAHDAGVDTIAFDSCLTSEAVNAVLARDLDEANGLAIGGTPALFVNGRMLQGAVSYETLSGVISEELQVRPH